MPRSSEKFPRSEKLKALGKLSASFAHEFNSPILGIRNVLEQVEEELSQKDGSRDLVLLAIKECEKLTELILKLQDIDPSSLTKLDILNVNEILEEILSNFQEQFNSKNINLKKNLTSEKLLLRANPVQFKKIVSSLITNALEAISNNRGKITILSEICQGKVKIHICDNGIGIPNSDLSQIFDPFFTTKSAVKATGLGLPIVFGLINRIGGTIHVTSQPGKGSTFTIELPSKES